MKEVIGLYIHVPFCKSKCPYCDFNTYEGIEGLMPGYVEALKAEIGMWGQLLDRPRINTIFFGGGTPSYMAMGQVEAIMEAVRQSFEVSLVEEVTLESNPDDVKRERFKALGEVGINRVSLGVQSLEERHLEMLGRRHSAREAVEAFYVVREAGFRNVNLDFMYGLPGQTLQEWQDTLDQALRMKPEHLSLYCLTLEGGTPMETWVRKGLLSTPDPDMAADMHVLAEFLLSQEGYEHYEISNWAQPGCESRHNTTYWENRPYLGVGPGAHSFLDRYRFFNLRSPREYIVRFQNWKGEVKEMSSVSGEALKQVPVVEGVEALDEATLMADTVILGLRLERGVSREEFERRFGVELFKVYGRQIREVANLGLLQWDGKRISLTPRGRMLANEVALRFLPEAA